MRFWALAVVVVCSAISYCVFKNIDYFSLLGGVVIGFIIALLNHDSKYLSFLANFISSKIHNANSSLYDKDNILLNINLDSMWFNVGYWKDIDPTRYSVSSFNPFILACQQMTSLLTTSVDLQDNSLILDVGSGCGEQDLFISKKFTNSKILAIELSPYQVQYAKNKSKLAKLSDHIYFEEGNAIDLDNILKKKAIQTFFGSPTIKFDVVFALDCAYHFNLRVDFLKQAWQVLRPGGKIGLADVCLADGVSMNNLNILSRTGLKFMLKKLSIPPENLVDMATYKRTLENCGFGQVVIQPITDHVFKGLLQFSEHVAQQLGSVVKSHRMSKLQSVISFLRMVISRGLLEYVIVSGIKTEEKYFG